MRMRARCVLVESRLFSSFPSISAEMGLPNVALIQEAKALLSQARLQTKLKYQPLNGLQRLRMLSDVLRSDIRYTAHFIDISELIICVYTCSNVT